MARAENNGLIDIIEQFYRRYYKEEIGELAQNYPEDQRSLYVDWSDLYRYDADLADDFLSKPDQLREYAEEALRLYDLPVDVSLGQAHVRIRNLPETTDIGKIRSRHINTHLSIEGTVERASEVKSDLRDAAFECQRCGTLTYIPQSTLGKTQEPHECQGCDRQGPFQVNQDQSEYVDAQTIHVKQRLSGVKTDDQASIVVELEDDLAGTVSPGDNVTVTGVVHLASENRTEASVADKFIGAHSVTVEDATEVHGLDITDEDKRQIVELSTEDAIYEQMVESFAPSVYGNEKAKLAILLQLFSGVTKHLPDGTRIRGDLHVALIGDPGTAKSRLIGYAGNLAPRTVKISGKNTSSVGLTATTKKTSSGSETWTFEAGALPMADKGLARIDNITDLRSEHLRTLHDVLEEQVIELTKATVSATIQARASVLAAGNPKYGRFDQYEPIGEQVDLDPGLISQFDLIFITTDQPDEVEDEKIADHVLQSNYVGELNTQRTESNAPSVSANDFRNQSEQVAPTIDPGLLRKYIAYARQNCFPTMTDEAMESIKDFYVDLRSKGADEDAPVPVTARKLEGLVRLAESSAKMRLSDSVEVEDAERVIELLRSCLLDLGVDPETGEFNTDVAEQVSAKRQRERIKNVKQLIAEIEMENDDGAPIDQVIEEASAYLGMEEKKFAHELDRLKQKGEVYEPAEGYLRTT
ncbi:MULTISPECIES: minichromosome maintenance protein MCM [Halorussus]|uniref:minichromosome maintenance protein MCM n=1 Tax=Halorussus TaxID=1070314 RepID=UPI0020A1EBA5|nr:minichromosome maintenance protein MCM [Halorussus vallis]USZ78686.1 minichromosome maintenance protein MCM [Halorussus vallis]